MEDSFDLIVIGGGSGGYAAARTARESVERVAIVDDAAELGGLCILRGCMPSKTLIYSAEVMHLAQNAGKFGLRIPEVAVDMPGLHQRKIRWVNDFKSYRQEQLQSDRFTLFREHARFIGPDCIELSPSGRKVRAKAFVIATGSVVSWPNVEGLKLPGIWTSDDVLDLNELPESIAILGGGVVACELAQFLHRIGSSVTQIQRSPRLLTNSASSMAADTIATALRDEGLRLHTGTHLQSIESCEVGFRVRWSESGNAMEVEVRHILNAMGRSAATSGLNLSAAGVDCHPNGQIKVDELQRSSNPAIFAAGDVCGPYEIVHIAIMQGETAARVATGKPTSPVRMDNRTTVTFTDPQIAEAGIPYEEALAAGINLRVADYPFNDHGKSMLMEAHHGYVRAWADADSGVLIGAECVGKDAGELIHAMAVAVSLRAKAKDLLEVHWYHPTLSEIWSYPLEEIAG